MSFAKDLGEAFKTYKEILEGYRDGSLSFEQGREKLAALSAHCAEKGIPFKATSDSLEMIIPDDRVEPLSTYSNYELGDFEAEVGPTE